MFDPFKTWSVSFLSFSVANLPTFPRIRACVFLELRVFLKTCRLLVLGFVFLKICLFFADFCFADVLFPNLLAILLFHFTSKGGLGVFFWSEIWSF